jgi:hypothetical protein
MTNLSAADVEGMLNNSIDSCNNCKDGHSRCSKCSDSSLSHWQPIPKEDLPAIEIQKFDDSIVTWQAINQIGIASAKKMKDFLDEQVV